MPEKQFMALSKEERLEAIKQKFRSQLPEDQRELRIVPGLEVRQDGDGEAKVIEGYAAVFNKDSDGLWFIERVAPGCFEESIQQDDIVGLFNHDRNIVLGRTSASTMNLEEDGKGLKYVIDLPETQAARDLHESISRGDIKGSSFSFTTQKDQWEYLDDGETVIRTLLKVKLYDVGPVTIPAYKDTTTSARSINDWIEAQLKDSEAREDGSWRIESRRRRLKLAALEF